MEENSKGRSSSGSGPFFTRSLNSVPQASAAGLDLADLFLEPVDRGVDYWVAPFMKLLGAIPSPTWIPVVMVVASSLFAGSVFIIALGV